MFEHRLVLAAGLLAFLGCGPGNPEPSSARLDSPDVGSTPELPNSTQSDAPTRRVLADGLTDEERSRFNHLSMGSELIPLRWLRVLHDHKTGTPFLEGSERFGLIADPDDPHGLPIGLTVADSPDIKGVGPVVGLNCAACHAGEIHYNGQTIVITGGQSLFDVVTFNEELFASMTATARDPKELIAFVVRLWKSRGYLSGDEQELARHMTALLAHLESASGDTAKKIQQRVRQLVQDAQARASRDDDTEPGTQRESRFGNLLDGFDEVKHRILVQAEHSRLPLKRLSEVHGREAVERFSRDVYITAQLLSGRKSMLRQLVALKHRDLPQTESGPGRVDDFNAGRNLLFPPDQAVGMTSPCSIPPLWGLHDVRWTDWDGNTTSALGRSMLTALAGGAAFDPQTFLSSVPPQNILQLEQLSETLTAPRWPEDVLGTLDTERVKKGRAVFQIHCARCHRPEDSKDGDVPKDGIVSLDEVKTDPQRLRNFSVPLADEPLAAGLQRVSGQYLAKARETGEHDREAFTAMERDHPNQWQHTTGYVARNLAGIFATAPYLHNGSIPTLWDLLHPPEQRPARFPVGHADYDPQKVGYRTTAKKDDKFVFDTTQTGNNNVGHLYGTDLSHEQKLDLLEYLKSL